MEEKFILIWEKAKPYLKKGIRKNFILHTKCVIEAVRLILKAENMINDNLIIAAILHDVGWANVPNNIQLSKDRDIVHEGMKLHLEYSKPIIRDILSSIKYSNNFIETIIDIVISHKFCKPKEIEKKLLIDADTLSDVFKEQFYSDCSSYNLSPVELYEHRKKNTFYTNSARSIFYYELDNRKNEIFK